MRGLSLGAAILALAVHLAPATLRAEPVTLTTTPIERFSAGGETRFGDLAFVGGFTFSSGGGRVAGLSAFRFTEAGGTAFLAVSDLGTWFTGRIQRDATGRPVGLAETATHAMHDASGAEISGKIGADAEALTIEGSRALVGFERNHRLLAYEGAPASFSAPAEALPLPLPRRELRSNKGIEAIATAPARTPLEGARLTLSEGSVDPDGNLFGAITQGQKSAVLKVKRRDDYSVSDAAFLPGGDLLILERRYRGVLGGLDIRIRRIGVAEIVPGALLDGPIIFHADLNQEIDNLEGIDVWRTANGETRIVLVSDDNASFLQRQMLLEFRLETR